ncbi:phage tail sheath family protein [Georgenia subflava]|uniref:Phage tail sheath family protein n=1 Tax=Georgenia subflava TaxID=1622177 RepID=A0A6N7EMD8_9MICO|nr:phage tail sheath subtilisin-like domain-containing protein [Georgenia subflava]MPV37306.1 phage tail sheath family protein [Georgenia subflava]
MSVLTTYPGVYIREIPSGSRTITGVATSITAFVGRAQRGELDEPVPIGSWPDFERRFGGLWRESGLGYAVRDFYLNGGSTALVVRVARDAATATFEVGEVTVEALGPGSWANPMLLRVSHPSPGDAAEVAAGQGGDVTATDLFTLEVYEDAEKVDDEAPVETHLNVTMVDGPRRFDLVLQSSRLLRATGVPTGARPDTGDITPATEGSDGDAPEAEDYVGDPAAGDDFAADKRGLYALSKADLFNLLVLPPPTPAGDLPVGLWVDAAAMCVDRRAFLIVDPPGATTLDQLKTWPATSAGLGGPATRNAAVYFPRIRRPDPLRGGAVADFAASGAVAGVIARTDATRGVWKAPAGTDASVVGAVGLSVPLTDAENGQLNPLGLNCLRTFRVIGSVVWGARTLRGADALADEYKYVPVRRLALFLEETLYRSTQWAVFEPNDRPLWSQLRSSIGAFMQDLFRQGAFQGASPREAYFVRCDEETTTQYDIDRGIVNIIVGFAPLKPAEFVVVGIQQKTAQNSA